MNPENQPVLASLLEEGLKSVTITRRGQGGSLSPRDYKLRVLRCRAWHNPSLHLDTFTFEPDIGDSAVREAVLTFLRHELGQFLHEDRTYAATYAIFGGLGSGSSIDDILKSLLKAAIVGTPQAAAGAFYDEISCGYLPFQKFFLLTGVKVDHEVQVFNGISLIPLSNKGAELPGYLPLLFGRDSSEFLSKTLLKVDMSVSPVLHKPDPGYTLQSGPDKHFTLALRSADQAGFHTGKFFQALTLVGEQPVMSSMEWTHMSDEHIFDLRISPGSGYSWALADASTTTFSEAQIDDAVEVYFRLVVLPSEVEQSLQIPLDRWMKSKTRQGYVDKMIDLGIAMESFYLRGIREELSFRFRLRAALHLGESSEDRKRLRKEFEQIYRYRSMAVHEGALPDHINVEGQSIRTGQYIERSQELFRRSLMKVIHSGVLPDWESIELGVDE